jgi:3-deoxy-D-manno-octulosonate 8-phosphate phosphatase (KDO 8-P phosphatase)
MENRTLLMNNTQRAKRIKWILMDVDGTLTDGNLYLLPDGEEIKGYNVKDGMGILMAHLAGLQTGIITGKTSKALEIRAEKLQISELFQGILNKKKALQEILTRNRIEPEETAFIGDDLGDLSVIKTVGLAAAVSDAHPEVKKHCHFICSRCGGGGAVREFIEFILEAQGHHWSTIEKRINGLKKKQRKPPAGNG